MHYSDLALSTKNNMYDYTSVMAAFESGLLLGDNADVLLLRELLVCVIR